MSWAYPVPSKVVSSVSIVSSMRCVTFQLPLPDSSRLPHSTLSTHHSRLPYSFGTHSHFPPPGPWFCRSSSPMSFLSVLLRLLYSTFLHPFLLDLCLFPCFLDWAFSHLLWYFVGWLCCLLYWPLSPCNHLYGLPASAILCAWFLLRILLPPIVCSSRLSFGSLAGLLRVLSDSY